MKKISVLLLTLCLFLSACSAVRTTKEDGKSYLILPVSGEKVEIDDDYASYVKDINADLLKAAEEKISEKISLYPEKSDFYLETYDGYLCLCVEVIVKIPPPAPSVDGTEEYEMQGCGIDHEHKFFRERITK